MHSLRVVWARRKQIDDQQMRYPPEGGGRLRGEIVHMFRALLVGRGNDFDHRNQLSCLLAYQTAAYRTSNSRRRSGCA